MTGISLSLHKLLLHNIHLHFLNNYHVGPELIPEYNLIILVLIPIQFKWRYDNKIEFYQLRSYMDNYVENGYVNRIPYLWLPQFILYVATVIKGLILKIKLWNIIFVIFLVKISLYGGFQDLMSLPLESGMESISYCG